MMFNNITNDINYLTEETVESFLIRCKGETDKDTLEMVEDILKKGLNFDVPFRQNSFKLVHILLLHSLREMYSNIVSDVPALNREGLIFLYGKDRVDDHQDGIDWDLYKNSKNRNGMSKKWDVKKIIFNEETKSFKLKNNKLGKEKEIMRRQVWKSKSSDWIKHEYKLLQREIVTDPTGDFIRENVSAQPFPVLVHYFKKKRKKQVRTRPPPDEEEFESGFREKRFHASEEQPPAPSNYGVSLSNMYNQFSGLAISQQAQIEITNFSPNYGFSTEYTSVLLYIPGITSQLQYEIRNGDVKYCPATVVGHSLIQASLPPHEAGFFSFFVIGKNKYNNIYAQVSQELIFTYLPSDPQGSVQMVGFLKLYPFLFDSFSLFRHTVKVLDLSDNDLDNLDFLASFELLEILILSQNNIKSETNFPFLARLRDLSVPSNKIQDVTMFLDNIRSNLPALQNLCTVDNPCCPYISRPQEYHKYRMIIISKLPNLVFLDTSDVTRTERQSSQFVQPKVEFDPQFDYLAPEMDESYLNMMYE